jgi:2-amino-4-hydroxy-6-hydroxymethyldihydropteridine diphosphokinase
MPEFRQALIGGGANLGDRATTLRSAEEALRRCGGVRSLVSSRWYETEPVGVTDQPAFLNVVYAVETSLSPESLLRELQRIEKEHGRVRRERWGPRTLDLDLLWYADETRVTADLTLPHPRLFERAFVLVPLRELLACDTIRGHIDADFLCQIESAPVASIGVRLLPTP